MLENSTVIAAAFGYIGLLFAIAFYGDRLTPAQRSVLVLRHFDDLSERDTAEVLGVSVGTVKSQNAAALARLRTGAPELLDLIGGPHE